MGGQLKKPFRKEVITTLATSNSAIRKNLQVATHRCVHLCLYVNAIYQVWFFSDIQATAR